jgi:hypothetical protein
MIATFSAIIMFVVGMILGIVVTALVLKSPDNSSEW